MRKLVNLVILAGVVSATACSSPDRAPVSASRQSASASSSQASTIPAGGIRLTPQNTRVEFVGSTERTSQTGSFEQLTGSFELKGNDPSNGRLAVDIDMDSTTTKIFLLTKHLKSSDYFDVKQYPRAWFVSTSIQPSNEPGATHVITGNLTLHGTTRMISTPASISLANGMLTLNARFVIRQSEFGMMEAVKHTKDEVPITVSIRAARS
jgi:polyisoprenoid-binding protein YceI